MPYQVENITIYGKKHKEITDFKTDETIVGKAMQERYVDKFKDKVLRRIYNEGQKLKLALAPSKEGRDTYSQVAATIVGLAKDISGIMNYTKSENYKESNGKITLIDPDDKDNTIDHLTYVNKVIQKGPISFERIGKTVVAEVGLLRIPVPEKELNDIIERTYDPKYPEKVRDFEAILFEDDLLRALERRGTTYGKIENIYDTNPVYARFKKNGRSLVTNYPSVTIKLNEKDSEGKKYEVVAYDIEKSGSGLEPKYSVKIYLVDLDGKPIVIYGTEHPNTYDAIYNINNRYTPTLIAERLKQKLK
jgi:hypothetical protein